MTQKLYFWAYTTENSNPKRYMHPNVHRCTVYNSQDKWMDKVDEVFIYNEILLNHKKEWFNAICSNMDGPTDYHSKWSVRQRKTNIILLICGIFKNAANEPIYKTESPM